MWPCCPNLGTGNFAGAYQEVTWHVRSTLGGSFQTSYLTETWIYVTDITYTNADQYQSKSRYWSEIILNTDHCRSRSMPIDWHSSVHYATHDARLTHGHRILNIEILKCCAWRVISKHCARRPSGAHQTQLFENRRQAPAGRQPDARQTPASRNVLKSGVRRKISKHCVWCPPGVSQTQCFKIVQLCTERHWDQYHNYDRNWSALIVHWALIEGVPIFFARGYFLDYLCMRNNGPACSPWYIGPRAKRGPFIITEE